MEIQDWTTKRGTIPQTLPRQVSPPTTGQTRGAMEEVDDVFVSTVASHMEKRTVLKLTFDIE